MTKIRKFNIKDTIEAALLIIRVYKKFNQGEATQKAIDDFVNSLDPEKIKFENLYSKLKKPIFFVVVEKEKLIGLIRGDSGRISSLFIDGGYQKQGLGKKLIETFIKFAKKSNSKSIKVRSSLFAVPFYERLRFKKTTGLRKFHGMKMYPMKKILM